jgi:hypothetical protein
MTPWAFCTDEDLATAAPTDFPILTPYDQAIARGKDGAIDPASPWTMSSSGTDFTLAGVAPGHVVQITGPRPPFHPPVETFGVTLSVGGSLTLKRRGQAAGSGLPPVLAVGVSGVCFSVLTLGPQIARASEDLERRFGVSDFITGRRVSDMWNPSELRDATVYSVLTLLYLDASRGSSDQRVGTPDVWGTKSRRYGEMLADLLSRVEIHWRSGSAGGGSSPLPSTSRLAMRIGR